MKDIVLDWGERLILLALFVQFAVRNIATNDWSNDLLVLLEAVTVVFVLIRRRALSVSESPLDWTLAVAGTMAPLLIRPGGESVAGLWATVLIVAGILCSFSAKASLNRRFGMAPANRGVQPRFAYALIRHPMYLGYIVAQAGYLLHNPTPWNLGVYLFAWSFQLARIHREERHLTQDPAYRDYAARVRYRLVPGVY